MDNHSQLQIGLLWCHSIYLDHKVYNHLGTKLWFLRYKYQLGMHIDLHSVYLLGSNNQLGMDYK